MNFNRIKLKEEAKAKIKGKVLNLAVANIIVCALTLPVNGIPVFGQIIAIAALVLEFGLGLFYLNFIDNNKIDYSDLFYSFLTKDINKFLIHLGTAIVKLLLIMLWTLLFIIPGIIKAIAYSQVMFIRAEKPDQNITECLKESETLMNGHKMEYFEMQLSFLGWFIIVALTCGIAGLYVLPYYITAMAIYYRQLKAAAEAASSGVKADKEPTIS